MIFKFHNILSKIPDLDRFSLKPYYVRFSLETLTPGVDNIRYDVHLSSGFCKTAGKIITRLVAKHTRSEDILDTEKSSLNFIEDEKEFRQLCQDIMTDAVNKSKLMNNVQIDYLVQTAIIKTFTENIRTTYDFLIQRLKGIVREYELSKHPEEMIRLKKRLTDIQQDRKIIIRHVSGDLFQIFADVQIKMKEIRKINFGGAAVLSDFLFSNPMLHIEDIHDDFFMIEEYGILLGRRLEDPDKYDTLITVIKHLLTEADKKMQAEPESEENHNGNKTDAYHQKIDAWLMDVNNIPQLFDYFHSKDKFKLLKKQKGDEKELLYLKQLEKDQNIIFSFFYKRLKKNGLIKRIVAGYEMHGVYADYCPPLVPQLVLQFLVDPKARKNVEERLKRLKNFYGKDFSVAPLKKLIKKVNWAGKEKRERYFLQFLNDFIRYHRDFQNFNMLRTAADQINLLQDERLINLSRANNTLYEFLLSHEQRNEERQIIRHVIIKADVRGSTDITHRMMERGLNPASHFSLNFFDPITHVLSEYGASKVFVEGDAIILSIFEREETPKDWYSVARACGLAINMLSIVRNYNVRNEKHQLPIIELGIGICYHSGRPLFLFDGDNRIMISSAINLADRLSGCSKSVKKQMKNYKGLFNMYKFQGATDEDIAATADDLSLRYNVNGIELNAPGFKKLSEEIDLKALTVNIPSHSASGASAQDEKEKVKIYTGKFPTTTGGYQRVVIREALVPRVDPDTLKVINMTSEKYYEVCTNPMFYEYIQKAEKRITTYPRIRN